MELQPVHGRSSVPPSWALWRLLDELESLLIEVAPEVYRARFVTDVSGSIGEHVRHCLDHVSALLAADLSTTLLADHALFHLEADLRWIDQTRARLESLRLEVTP